MKRMENRLVVLLTRLFQYVMRENPKSFFAGSGTSQLILKSLLNDGRLYLSLSIYCLFVHLLDNGIRRETRMEDARTDCPGTKQAGGSGADRVQNFRQHNTTPVYREWLHER